MANKNRLEIRIEAKDDAFRASLSKMSAEAKKTAAGIKTDLTSIESGTSALESVINDTADSFSGVGSKAQSELSKVEKASIEAGSALDKSFDNIDVDKTVREVNFLEDALEKAGYTTGALQKVEDSLEDIEEAAKGAGDSLGDAFQAQALGDFAGKVSEAGKDVSEFFSAAAEDARNLEKGLKRTFSDNATVEKFSKELGALKAEFGDALNSEDAIKALQKLESGGIATVDNLKQVINIAEATGRSYDEIAEKQAEFFAAADGGVVNIGVLEEYRKTLGVGAKDLEQYGAKLDENNKLLGDTPEQIAAAQKALQAYLTTNDRFANVLQRSQDNMDKLDAQVGALNESLGVQVNEFKNIVAGGLLPFVEGLNNSSDSIKKFVGLSIAGGSAIAQYGGKAVEFAAHAKAAGLSVAGLTGGIQKATVAARAFIASTAGMAAGLAIAAAGIVLITKNALDYAETLNQAEQAEQSLIATQARAVNSNKDRIASIEKSTDALRKEYESIEEFGKRRSAIAADILLKESAAADAREEGNNKLAGQLEAEARILRSVRSEYDLEAATVAATEKKKEAAREKGLEAFKKGEAERAEAREEQRKQDEENAKRRLELDRQYQEQSLNLERSAIQQRVAIASESPELDALEKRLDKGENVIAQIREEATEQKNKLQSLLDEEAALDRIAIAREKNAAIEADPQGREQIEQQAVERRRQLEERVAAEKAKLDRELETKLAAAEEKRAAIKKQKAKEAADQELKLAEISQQRAEIERQTAEETFALRAQQLDEEERRGQDVAQARLNLEKEIQEARKKALNDQVKQEIDLILRRRDSANVGATQAQQALNNKQAELDILKAQQKVKQESKTIDDEALTKAKQATDEIRAQIEEQKKLNEEKKKGFEIESSFGGLSGVENINEFGGGFGTSRFKDREETPKEKTEQELEQDFKRAKIKETEAREKAKGKTDKPTPIDDSQRIQTRPTGSSDPTLSAAEAYAQGAQDSAAAARPVEPSLPMTAPSDPAQLSVLQQILAAIQQTAQNTKPQPQQTQSVAQNWERGGGFTLGS